jgi:hypothetical protein
MRQHAKAFGEGGGLFQDCFEMDYLAFNLRRQDAPGQRRIMRRYGARFHYRAGETPDLEEPVKAKDPGLTLEPMEPPPTPIL